jgi:hypothetical protein
MKEINLMWNLKMWWNWRNMSKKHSTFIIDLVGGDAFPSSLIESNVSLKWKQQKSKESGHTP